MRVEEAKMKYAFMSFSCPQLSLAEMLALAKRLGYEGIEPRLSTNHQHGIEPHIDTPKRRELRRKVAESGVPLACIATSCRYADPADAERQIEETRRCIDLAGDLGVPRIRVFGGRIAKGLSREDAITLVADSLLALADQAKERGVIVCMETHDDWCHPDHVAQVMRRVNHSYIAVNWDIMHPILTGKVTMDYAFQTLKPWIRHVHFHDGKQLENKLQLTPIGTGDIDHRRALELLIAAGYKDYLSGEWIDWEPYETHLPRELATMKRYEEEIKART